MDFEVGWLEKGREGKRREERVGMCEARMSSTNVLRTNARWANL